MRGLTCASGRDSAELAATRAGRRRAGDVGSEVKLELKMLDLKMLDLK